MVGTRLMLIEEVGYFRNTASGRIGGTKSLRTSPRPRKAATASSMSVFEQDAFPDLPGAARSRAGTLRLRARGAHRPVPDPLPESFVARHDHPRTPRCATSIAEKRPTCRAR